LIKYIERIRNGLIVKHYLATEFFVNKEDLGKLCEDEIIIVKISILLAKIVSH